jgi:hypothetical protein
MHACFFSLQKIHGVKDTISKALLDSCEVDKKALVANKWPDYATWKYFRKKLNFKLLLNYTQL